MDSWLESFALANFQRSSDIAHDLKTPLNVAVLNLELLRLRLRKLAGEDDAKLEGYGASIEIELRRMARIFDVFFLLSTPPANEGGPVFVDLCALCTEIGAGAGYEIECGSKVPVRGHESRLRQAVTLMFEGARKQLRPEGRTARVTLDGEFALAISGTCAVDDFEVSKVFKFYYTGPDGNPDLSLATARLIVETYGGSMSASQDRDKVSFRITFPTG